MIVRKLQVANLLLEPYFGYLFCHHFKPVAKKLAAQVWLMAFLYYRKSTFSGLLSVTARTSDGHLGLRGSINWGWGQFSIGQRRSIARRGRRVVSGFYEAGNCDSRLYWQKETTTYYFWYSKQNDSSSEAKMGKQPSNLIRTIVCSLTILSLLDSSKWLSGDSPITSVSTH